jgi:hypothetical protein
MKKTTLLYLSLTAAALAATLGAVNARAAGDLYVADAVARAIYKFTPAGEKSTFASDLHQPVALAFDGEGNLFVADSGSGIPLGSSTIFKFTPDGVKSTFAAVESNSLFGMAFDGAGNLFVSTGLEILKFAPDGTQSTFASGVAGVWPLAFDQLGNLYAGVNPIGSSSVLKFAPDGSSSTFTSFPAGSSVTALAFDSGGDLFVKNLDSILRVTSGGSSTTFASGAFAYPLAFDDEGNLFAALDAFNTSEAGVVKFTPAGTETTFAFGPLFPSALAFVVPQIAKGTYDKIIVVIGENLGYEPLLDPTNDVYNSTPTHYIHDTLAGFAVSYTDAHSGTHPSLPNYLRIFAGDDSDNTGNALMTDGCVCNLLGGNIQDPCGNEQPCGTTKQILERTKATLYSRLKNNPNVPPATPTDFVLYAEGLHDATHKDNFVCTNADYAQKHNPAAYFTVPRADEDGCTDGGNGAVWKSFAQDSDPPAPASLFATGHRGVAFIIPGLDHDGHDPRTDPVAAATAWNDWLQNRLVPAGYIAYARNSVNRTLLIITQDEQTNNTRLGTTNHIMLFLISAGSGLQGGTKDGRDLSTCAQYNILKTMTQNFGVGALGNTSPFPPIL